MFHSRRDLVEESVGSRHVHRLLPLLEDLTMEMLNHCDIPTLPESTKPERHEPAALSPFRGSLRLRQFRLTNNFVSELLKYRVQYNFLSFCEVIAWTGIRELIVARAPTLQVLDFFNLTCKYSFLPPHPTEASVDCECLILWDSRRAETTLGSFAEPRLVRRVKGNQPVSDRPWDPETSSRSLIDDIFTPPSKGHPHHQRQSFRPERQIQRGSVGSGMVDDSRRCVFAVSREESGGRRGCHASLGDEVSEFGIRVRMVYATIQRSGEGQS